MSAPNVVPFTVHRSKSDIGTHRTEQAIALLREASEEARAEGCSAAYALNSYRRHESPATKIALASLTIMEAAHPYAEAPALLDRAADHLANDCGWDFSLARDGRATV